MAVTYKEWLPGTGIYIGIGIDFTSNWNTTSPSYTSVTGDVRFQDGVSWSRGQNQTWDQMAPGQFNFTLNNRGGTYDPATNSNMVGNRLCQISMAYPNTSSPVVQYTGLVDNFVPSYPASGKDATVKVSGVDLLTSLYLSKILSVASVASTAVGQLQSLATAAGVPSAWQSFTAGSYTLKPAKFVNTDVLSGMTNIVQSQVQFMYASKSNVLTTIPLQSGSVTQTYGDGGGSELPYADVNGRVGGAGTYTVVQLSQSGNVQVQSGSNNAGVTQTVPSGSTTNTGKFGRIVLALNVAAVTNPQTVCNAWTAVVPNPSTYWFTDLTVKPLMKPASLVPAVLAHELGDRITVKRRPLSGGTVTKSQSIRAVACSLSGSEWMLKYTLTNT